MQSMVEGIIAMLAGPKATVAKARKLRRVMTWPEVILWRRLRQRPGEFKFRRQHPAGRYILDFFCSEALLAIEIDGLAHDLADRPDHDKTRDDWLAERGVQTLRLSAGDVTRDPDGIVDSILSLCVERTNPLHRSSSGPPPRSGEETQ